MFWQRLLFGMLMIAAVIGLVVLDARLSAGVPLDGYLPPDGTSVPALVGCGLPVALLVVGLVIFSTYELGRLCRSGQTDRQPAGGGSGLNPVTHWAAFVGAGLVIIPWVGMQQRLGTMAPPAFAERMGLSLTVFWVMAGVLGSCLGVLSRKTTQQALANIAVTAFMILYLGLLGSFVVRIRGLRPGSDGAALVALFMLTVKSGDIGAYFTGLAAGRHKLCPWLSPGKTIEGAVGAVVLAAGVAAGGVGLWGRVGFLPGTPPLTIAQAIMWGAVMAIAGHAGDLVESAFKRDLGAKDSGRVIPAFGGLLDLIDSPLLAAPLAWFLLTFWAPIR